MTTTHHARTKTPIMVVASLNFGVGKTRRYKRRMESLMAVMLKPYKSEPAYED